MQPTDMRSASHAGSWYEGNRDKLDQQLSNWLSKAQTELKNVKVKGVIGPHAGYTYCGQTAAWGYQYLEPKEDLKVFLFGPSHRAYFKGCLLSSLKQYETPNGNIDIDTEIIEELMKTQKFNQSDKKTEEKEHSLEMHLPFIYKMLSTKKFKLIPVMVGDVNEATEVEYGQIFAKYIQREDTLFCISSDFCHWGDNFDYTPYDQSGSISQYIEKLDKQGASFIQQQNPKQFRKYLSETHNTICGRNPICIFLNALTASGEASKTKTHLCHYSQSGVVKNQYDSSVSYAALVTYYEQ